MYIYIYISYIAPSSRHSGRAAQTSEASGPEMPGVYRSLGTMKATCLVAPKLARQKCLLRQLDIYLT